MGTEANFAILVSGNKAKNVSFVPDDMHVTVLRLSVTVFTRLGAYQDKRAVGTGSGQPRRWYLWAAWPGGGSRGGYFVNSKGGLANAVTGDARSQDLLLAKFAGISGSKPLRGAGRSRDGACRAI
jgi:hypothetical protein